MSVMAVSVRAGSAKQENGARQSDNFSLCDAGTFDRTVPDVERLLLLDATLTKPYLLLGYANWGSSQHGIALHEY